MYNHIKKENYFCKNYRVKRRMKEKEKEELDIGREREIYLRRSWQEKKIFSSSDVSQNRTQIDLNELNF